MEPLKNSLIIAGMAVRTSNQNGEAARDIPLLWQKFMSGNIPEKIRNKADESIYCVYTDYEGDFTQPYTTLLGCRVFDTDTVPDGLEVREIPVGTYEVFTAAGKTEDNVVYQEWLKIWNSGLNRTYQADFEVYPPFLAGSEKTKVKIYIGIKE